MPAPDPHPRDAPIGLEEAYAVEGPDENRRLYSAWAATYEASFVAAKGYVYHRRVAEVFCSRFSQDEGVVLDVGCGTGVVGVELRRLGIAVIDGIDISPEMLERARAKRGSGRPTYRRLIEADLTTAIDVADDGYAGVVSAGTFTHGHLGPDALSELIRVAAPGALCAMGINSAHFEALGFRDYLDRSRAAGLVSAYELVDALVYEGASSGDPDNVARIAVFTVT